MSFFRNFGILLRFWVPEIDNFARKLSLFYVEMMKITKYVHFRKIILFVKHPTLGCFISVKLEKSKFLKFFLIFLKFSRLLLRVTIFLLRNRITRTKKRCCKLNFIASRVLTRFTRMVLSWLMSQNLRQLSYMLNLVVQREWGPLK